MQGIMRIYRALGETVSHTLTKPKLRTTLSKTLLNFVVPIQSVFVRTQLKSPLVIIVGGSERSRYVHSTL